MSNPRTFACAIGRNRQSRLRWLIYATFAIGDPCRFIRVVNVGRNHDAGDCLRIEAWEIFGSLFDSAADTQT
jgi:hypothetical protein